MTSLYERVISYLAVRKGISIFLFVLSVLSLSLGLAYFFSQGPNTSLLPVLSQSLGLSLFLIPFLLFYLAFLFWQKKGAGRIIWALAGSILLFTGSAATSDLIYPLSAGRWGHFLHQLVFSWFSTSFKDSLAWLVEMGITLLGITCLRFSLIPPAFRGMKIVTQIGQQFKQWFKKAFSLKPTRPAKTETKERKKRQSPSPKKQIVKPVSYGKWQLPPLNIFTTSQHKSKRQNNGYLQTMARLLEETLKDFGVEGKVVQINPGPVVTMYEFEPAPGVKISRISSLADDLALKLKAGSIRVVAPIPGKAVVGIEVPNAEREIVYLRDILEAPAFHKAKLPLALGKNIFGEPVVSDLTKMPHLLIAGATGSGKSVCLNVLICGLLTHCTPEYLKFLLVDPKRIELSYYNNIPHLLYPVITDMDEANQALKWAVWEMERRYELLANLGARNLDNYNAKIQQLPAEQKEQFLPLPYLVIIIDELADLMIVASKEVQTSLVRLAQMARAAGVHLILATQRPSVDVITGVIKANFPARISFQVSSKTDSRTILDVMGAEKLLGRGDMLFLPPGTSKLQRLHGAYVSEEEIKAVVDFWKEQGEPEYISDLSVKDEGSKEDFDFGDYDDEKYKEAVRLVIRTGKASISMVQRHLRIGYNRAARLIERMEEEGIVSPSDGIRPRQVLVKEWKGER